MFKWIQCLLILGLGLALMSACGGSGETPGGGTFVWIDVPVSGLTVPVGQSVQVEGHAASSSGIGYVEIWVDGALATTISSLSMEGDLARFNFEWTPPSAGEYTIQAISFDSGGIASEPDSTRVFVGEIPSSGPDLAIVSVEALIAGDKDGIPFCNTRVVYSNVGSEAIPGDFSIQFSFDGTPQETVTVAGGLMPGASTEATFVYQYSDLHYVGINLDSGNIISELNEGNNAFAEARMCAESSVEPTLVGCPTPVGGGPTPVSCSPQVDGCPTPVGGGPTPVSCPTLVNPVITDTPTSLPGATIQFWADPPKIQAGACTTIRWHAENVQGVVFGGIQQPLDGSYQDCLCSNQRYTLTVTHLNGTEEKRTMDINVTGECVTPISPPPQDTTPPPAPSPAVPQNGLTIACKGSQSLAWLPVDDPSGINNYQVEVQRHSGDNNWQTVGGSPFSTGSKTVNVPVECGWYYRWRVRATDGAGNVGSWSGWSQFAITLT